MSRENQLVAGAPTGKLLAVAACACADDAHRWSAPVVENVDTARITRWRCTCPHCQCDALHLEIDPTRQDTTDHTCSAITPVGHVIESELPVQRDTGSGKRAEAEKSLYERVLAGLAAL